VLLLLASTLHIKISFHFSGSMALCAQSGRHFDPPRAIARSVGVVILYAGAFK
jgi:hypothetical protein